MNILKGLIKTFFNNKLNSLRNSRNVVNNNQVKSIIKVNDLKNPDYFYEKNIPLVSDSERQIELKNYNVPPFDSIFINSKLRLEININVGIREGFEVTGTKNLVSSLQSKNLSNYLILKSENPFHDKGKVKINIFVPYLKELRINGKVICSVKNIKSDKLNVFMDGATKLYLNGQSENLDLNVSGFSNIDAEKLLLKNSKVNILGNANVTLTVEKSLEAYISGSGIIDVYGNPPHISEKIDGKGKINNLSSFYEVKSDSQENLKNILRNSFGNLNDIPFKEEIKEKIQETIVETVIEDIQETIVETTVEDVQEIIVETVIEEIQETIAETVIEDVQETIVETVIEEIQEPIVETAVEEIQETIVETAVEEIQEPIVETTVEEIQETIVETVVEEIQETIVETVVEEIQEPIVENIIEDVQETIVETVIENIETEPLISDVELRGNIEAIIPDLPENNENSVLIENSKRIILDEIAISEVKGLHSEIMDKLNEVLKDDSDYEYEISNYSEKDLTLEDVFNSNINEMENKLNFTGVQKEFIDFLVKNTILSEIEVTEFAKSKNIFKNQLINGINELSYEFFDDNLIEEFENGYNINLEYIDKIHI